MNQSIHTLTALLDKQAKSSTKDALYFLATDLAITEKMSYQQLQIKAKSIAALLQQNHVQKGDRVLLLYHPGLDFICAFFGCLYAGAVAVPCYPPANKKLVEKLSLIIQNSTPKIILSSHEIVKQIRKLRMIKLANKSAFLGHLLDRFAQKKLNELTQWDFDKFRWVTTDRLSERKQKEFRKVPVQSDDIAFLQYTSGSTSMPKGVMISHGNLISNIAAISEAVHTTSQDRVVCWLPPYHDMGLIGGILTPIYNDMVLYLMSPIDFLKRPLHWLQAISIYQATLSVAPNFAYSLCCQKISAEEVSTLNLQHWRAALNGAEPINYKVIEQFSHQFAPCGFKAESFFPCYGLAESTLFVTGKFGITTRHYSRKGLREHHLVADQTGSHDRQTLVSCGKTPAGLQLIHIETKKPITNGIGEICLNGSSVTQGYWENEANEENFIILNHDGKEERYFKTGDLGFIEDGELYITGRIKELIIIRGKNHYPQDIENSVYHAAPLVRHGGCAAFPLEVNGEEKLGLVAEVGRGLTDEQYQMIFAEIKNAISIQHHIMVHSISLIPPKMLHKTTSGKIQRYANRAALLNHELTVLASYTAEDKPTVATTSQKPQQASIESSNDVSLFNLALRAKMREELKKMLNVTDDSLIKDEQSFSEYGLDSLMAVELENKLQHQLKGIYHLTPNDVFDYPNIASLSNHIEKEVTKASH